MLKDQFDIPPYKLAGLGAVNIILGKNGAGKSKLLRHLEQRIRSDAALPSKYIIPERAGSLQWQAHIEQTMSTQPEWVKQTRARNQFNQFREQVVATYRRLELASLRKFENTKDSKDGFDHVVAQINSLLDHIRLIRKGGDFEIVDKVSAKPIAPDEISSGEAELISLGIETLEFSINTDASKSRLLILDEPDVHLHPDLQARLGAFLVGLWQEQKVQILLASHSTALLGAFATESPDVRVAFLSRGQTALAFESVDHILKRLLPVFGAHPLSNLFNEAPPLLVEGEDDERIWQQAVRSSNGTLRVYPCSVDGKDELDKHEKKMVEILKAVYDDGRAYSVRDGDDPPPKDIADMPPVVRLRLACRDPENLLLTDEVLASLSMGWTDLVPRIQKWISDNPAHPHIKQMTAFRDGGFDRRFGDIKDVRIDLLGLIGTSRPWEIAVGRVLGGVKHVPASFTSTSIYEFLGKKICQHLLPT